MTFVRIISLTFEFCRLPRWNDHDFLISSKMIVAGSTLWSFGLLHEGRLKGKITLKISTCGIFETIAFEMRKLLNKGQFPLKPLFDLANPLKCEITNFMISHQVLMNVLLQLLNTTNMLNCKRFQWHSDSAY